MPEPDDRERLASLLRGARLALLTGAGISTESGIPDYRGPETQRRARNPIRFADYMRDDHLRARYWARSMLGWARFSAARPNAGHRAVAELEARGLASGPITQNVDRLHHAAGSRDVIELHGALAEVRCLDCDLREARDRVQVRLEADNATLLAHAPELAPDGDAELDATRALLEGFVVPRCLACGGTLKPDVVFFGENVRRELVDTAYARVAAADALLVIGSSLAVFSGHRFVRRAHELGKPVAIVSLGPTRGDELASVRVEARAGELLPWLVTALG
ncbi:MAG: NAD-dependent protein deacetylase [Sandaracinaceae bacterium]|nr:NAD-dependent protein deacetylase [Sandaracinaceae bacterium]